MLTIVWFVASSALANMKTVGDSIYERFVEYSLTLDGERMLSERDEALQFFSDNEQWEHYYYVASLTTMAKVLSGSQTMAGLRECRKLYEFARENHHEYGRAVVMAQIGVLYGYIGDHEEAVRQMREAFRLLQHHPMNRDGVGMFYYYAYVLELTGNYEEEARVIGTLKPYIENYAWGDTTSIVYRTYRDNLLNAEALLEVRLGHLERAGQLVNQLLTKIDNHDETNKFEALRAIAEYYNANGDKEQALATTDRMRQLTNDPSLLWGLTLLRTGILRQLGQAEEAYDELRPMIEQRTNDRMSQLRQQLNEMDAMTQIDELKIRKGEMQFWYAITVAHVIVIALIIFIVFRSRSAKRLKKANAELRTAYDQLEETTTAKERIESELRIARDIQMSMVPRKFPDRKGLDLYATMAPAREVGGDLYDYLLLDDHLLYFCVGDVSGKGVPASLFMAQAIRLFRTHAKQRMMPAEIARHLNLDLSENNDNNMFVTMFIALADLSSGRLEFCNCGHNPPILGIGQQARFLDILPNFPIGLWGGLDYTGEHIDNISGQYLFIYTDGLNEAENRQQEQFGDQRLLSSIQHADTTSARQLIDKLTSEVEKHRDGAEPSDDLTMLCLLNH
jgi:serine phosphatase RsbU (regulator of sigma subunit)